MEAQTAQGIGLGPVLFVPRHRVAYVLHMHPDLVLPSGVDGHVQQGIAAPRRHSPVVGHGPAAVQTRLAGEDQVCGRLDQVGHHGVLRRLGRPLHHGVVAPAGDDVVPVLLECLLCVRVLGENQHPGGLPVQAVDHENLRVHVLGLHIVGHLSIGRPDPLPLIAHAEQAGGLVHRDEPLVLVEDGEG